MKNKIIIHLLLAILILEVVFAAPLPWGIAIKEGTNECAGYWGGDEYYGYNLPSGWTAYYPGSNEIISTEFGSCNFRKYAGDPPGEEEKCCQVLGLAFVSENIGEHRGIWQLFSPPTLFWTITVIAAFFMFLFFVFMLLLIIRRIIKKIRKSK